MRKLFVLVLLCFTVTCSAHQVQDLIAPPEQYQGVWKLLGISEDKGVTSQPGSYQAFCKMTATKVHIYNGAVYNIRKVGIVVEDNIEYVTVLFDNVPDIMWVISEVGDSKILVQTFRFEPYGETFRALFLVMK